MRNIKGDRLHVNLSASQVRRRLKGFGHGVRKVQSAGKNQAVIIHTATGQHLVELKSVFADVLLSDSGDELGVPDTQQSLTATRSHDRPLRAAGGRWRGPDVGHGD